MELKTEYQSIMDSLKAVLKHKKISYADIAEELDMSESSIKRIFNAKDGSFGKVQQICEMAETSLSSLVATSLSKTFKGHPLTQKQEKYFLKHPETFAFLTDIYEYKISLKDMKLTYGLSDKSITLYLIQLEKLDLLELHPGNKIKWKIQGNIEISPNGKLARSLLEKAMNNMRDKLISGMREETEKSNDPKNEGTFFMGSLFFTPETSKHFQKELHLFGEQMAKKSFQEMEVYPTKDLVNLTYSLGLLPTRMLNDPIPNL